MTYPTWTSGEALSSADMNRVGLWRITTASLTTGASAVGVNSCFSSSFDHYRVLFYDVSPSTTVDIRWRLRTAGSGNATANYWMQNISASASSISAFEETAMTSFRFNYAQGASNAFGWADIYYPFAATNTTVNWTAMSYAGNIVNRSFLGFFNASTSFDGIEVVVGVGTVTAKLAVYGYNKG